MHEWAQWLAETPGSVALIESTYAYPVIESIHVWTLALFIGFAALLDLRLLGLTLRQIPISRLASRLLPWTIAGFVITLRGRLPQLGHCSSVSSVYDCTCENTWPQ